jgi:XTP/dITP diphosphohydrolase
VTHLVVVATNNAHKVEELRALFADLPVRLATPREVLGRDVDVEEDRDTFEGNALKKAEEIAKLAFAMALADDSGLEVDALGGAPGVHSKRFAHAHSTDAENNALLLEKLTGISERTARFRCVLALVDPYAPNPAPVFAHGTVEGHIGTAPRGEHGFGYDPLFVVKGGERTMAELTATEKNAISHRARASAQMRLLLERALLARSPRDGRTT